MELQSSPNIIILIQQLECFAGEFFKLEGGRRMLGVIIRLIFFADVWVEKGCSYSGKTGQVLLRMHLASWHRPYLKMRSRIPNKAQSDGNSTYPPIKYTPSNHLDQVFPKNHETCVCI
jgi:hypothetical protein